MDVPLKYGPKMQGEWKGTKENVIISRRWPGDLPGCLLAGEGGAEDRWVNARPQ